MIMIYCNRPYEGTTVNGATEYSNYNCLSEKTLEGPEKVHLYVLEETGDLTIQLTTGGVDLDLFLMDVNACSENDCVGLSITPTGSETITQRDLPHGNYYIIVDGQFAFSRDSYTLTLENCPPTICNLEVAVDTSCSNGNDGTAVPTSLIDRGFEIKPITYYSTNI